MTTSIRSEATKSVVVVNGVDRIYVNADGSIEAVSPPAGQSGNKLATFGALPFTKEYVSVKQSITTGAPLTIAHSLGVVPKLINFALVCVTAEQGYTAGQILSIGNFYDAGTRPTAVVYDASAIYVRYNNNPGVFGAANFSTGNSVSLTNANWRLIVRAWA